MCITQLSHLQLIIDTALWNKATKWTKMNKVIGWRDCGGSIHNTQTCVSLTYLPLLFVWEWRNVLCAVQKKLKKKNHPLIRGLNRGIALHHDGLVRPCRHLVEALFRSKQIKICISQGTLAMGINMPARTVVFAGDDSDLSPLNYRQMMGLCVFDHVVDTVFSSCQ